MIIFFALVFFLGFPVSDLGAEEIDYYFTGSTNNGPPIKADIFFIKENEKLSLKISMSDFSTQQDIDKSQRTICWYRIKPVLKEYSNLWFGQDQKRKGIHLEPIEYEKLLLASLTGKTIISINDIIKKRGCGTYYFTAEPYPKKDSSIINHSRFFETDIVHKKTPGKIVQVVVRPDDTYIGYLSELLKTPFIIAPMLSTGGHHQTDFRVGSDCAAFAIYGKRRQGFRIPYAGPRGIIQYLYSLSPTELQPVRHNSTEKYMDRHGKVVKTGENGLQPGDIIHFGEQVSVFFQDRGSKGILDKDDYLFQSYQKTPYITSLAQSGFYHKSIRIFRWKLELPGPMR